MKNLKGIITALATPFKEGKIDKLSFEKLLDFQIQQSPMGFVLNGTTGESPALSQKELEKLFEWTHKKAKKTPLILGLGGNSTQKILEKLKWAKSLRPKALLSVVPYYNKPPQRGMIKHFNTLADKSPFPVILYNVPQRTGLGLSLESVCALSQHPNIIGIKEASGDLDFGAQIIKKTKNFTVLSGDDETGLALCAKGAKGIVSVLSHILGKQMKSYWHQIKRGETDKALKEYKKKYGLLLKNIYSETNPIGIKMALKLMGIFKSAELRSPLFAMEKQKALKLKKSLKSAGLL